MHQIACVDEVPEQCVVCRAPDKAPDAPTAGTSAVATLSEELHGGTIVLRRCYCRACRGRLLQVFPSHTRSYDEPPGSLGRRLQISDWGFWPSDVHPDG